MEVPHPWVTNKKKAKGTIFDSKTQTHNNEKKILLQKSLFEPHKLLCFSTLRQHFSSERVMRVFAILGVESAMGNDSSELFRFHVAPSNSCLAKQGT